MTALERLNMMRDNPSGYQASAQAESNRLTARIKVIHDSHGCTTWETWTEYGVRCIGGGIADVTFVGCRECKTAIAMQ